MEGNGTAANPYVITDVTELQDIRLDKDAHYVLGNDIDASETATWNNGSGFEPIGEPGDGFTGTLDGRDHTIEGLVIDRPDEEVVGLFESTSGTVESVHLSNATVRGENWVGVLAGANVGTIRGTSAAGRVTVEETAVGGLVGLNDATIATSNASADVTGPKDVGGLVGTNRPDGTVVASAATGAVTGTDGDNARGFGGLVGRNWGTVEKSYATGDVSGEQHVGGLVGANVGPRSTVATVTDTYATGNVSGAEYSGGLVGDNEGVVNHSFAVGHVSSSEDEAGGLIGRDTGTITDVYWDVEATSQSNGTTTGYSNATGLSTGDLTGERPRDTTALDFESTWTTTGGYPDLRINFDTVAVTASGSAARNESASTATTEAGTTTAADSGPATGTNAQETGSSATSATDAERADETAADSGPGFGAVAALCALAGLPLALGRRN